MVPLIGSLFQSIEALDESANVVRMLWILKSFSLSNLHFLLDCCIKEGIPSISMMNTKLVVVG